jgi:DNA-binding transcriptional regulator GbsR (MarR family)
MFNRTDVEAFLKGFKEVFNEEINANKELLWYIAECFEEKWNQKPSAQNAKESIEKLKDLPSGIDDSFRELLLKTWQQRLEEQLIKDVFSDDEKTVIESIAYIRNGNTVLPYN